MADSDCVLSQEETLQDMADLDNFKSAMRAAEISQQLITLWNKSKATLHSYLINSDYCGKDLSGWPTEPQSSQNLLTTFSLRMRKTGAAETVSLPPTGECGSLPQKSCPRPRRKRSFSSSATEAVGARSGGRARTSTRPTAVKEGTLVASTGPVEAAR
jgi:hypothetical protein